MRVRIEIAVDGITDELRKMPDRGKALGKEILGTVTAEIAAVARATAPFKSRALRGSVRNTRPVMTAQGVISASVVAGGAGLVGSPGRGATAHVRAFRAAFMKTRAANVYGAVQEAGHERSRSGAQVTLHSTTGQAHFIEVPALRLAATVPDRFLARLDEANAR